MVSMNKSSKLDLSGKTVYTGRQLYEAQFISTLNKKPVGNLVTHVKSCYEGGKLIPTLDDMLTNLLVDGSIIIYNNDFAEGEILYISEVEAVLKRGKIYTYINKTDTLALIADFTYYEPDKSENVSECLSSQIGKTITVSTNMVLLYPNGNGILADFQKTLLRIETIYNTLNITTPMEAMIFMTNMANSADKMNVAISEKLQSNKPIVPIPAGSTIQQPNFSSLTTRLFNELNILIPNYMEATYNYNTFPNESGIARAYAMERFLSKAGDLKNQCVEIYGMLGYDITFLPSDISESEEDNKKIEAIYTALDRNIISQEEATEKVRSILGFSNSDTTLV